MSPVEEENWGRIEGEFAVKKKQKTTVIEGEIFSGGELEGKWRGNGGEKDRVETSHWGQMSHDGTTRNGLIVGKNKHPGDKCPRSVERRSKIFFARR